MEFYCIVYNNKTEYKTPWNKGLTKLENESLKRAGEKISLLLGSFLGKHHSKETKQKISVKMSERNNGIVKYYEIFCPFENSNIVQGTWERDFALYLNEYNINKLDQT